MSPFAKLTEAKAGMQQEANMNNMYDVLVIDMKAIGNRIKKLRKEKRIKVTDISDRLGFSTPQAVYKWQRGECLPDIVNMLELTRMLDTTVEHLMLGDDER